ncbi:hypothetical protein TNCV_1141921 [Trichonephila clavipes]|nr:hypothetical protein TNCV_1141921 [Trichonephila clavipes]
MVAPNGSLASMFSQSVENLRREFSDLGLNLCGRVGLLAASPLDERKVTLRSLKPTASAATPLIRTAKERRTGSPVSPYPSRPAQLTYAAGSNPLRRTSRQAPETSSQTQTTVKRKHTASRDEDLSTRSGAPAPSIQHLWSSGKLHACRSEGAEFYPPLLVTLTEL